MVKKNTILELIQGKTKISAAAERLGCTRRTVERNRQKFFNKGPEGFFDHRGGNQKRLLLEVEDRIVICKLEGKHRSARFIKDHLKLMVHRETFRRVLVRHHLSRITLPPVKRVERFEAPHPNAL